MLTKIKKRDGTVVDFDEERIVNAIFSAAKAVGGKDIERAREVTQIIVKELESKFDDNNIPNVEQVQDIVEKVLIEQGHAKTAKAYILYRHNHQDLREFSSMLGNFDLMEDYLNQNDWRVKENANMTYSLQGLNYHLSSELVAKYWLNKLYPSNIANAHKLGDFHIHDLGSLAAYCVGWDLQDLLSVGFKGVPGKVASKPAKHLRTALGQITNFFYTLQGEAAGAQAFSNFDSYLAPFIRHDKMNYEEVKQAMQEFIYNVNVPTRVGFQCVSEDTEILTSKGWSTYDEVNEGDIIKTFNLKTKKIENQKVTFVFRKKYKGKMYNLKNRIQDQLISPKHRVVRKLFNSDDFVLQPIEEVSKLKSPFIIPIAGKTSNKKSKISNEQIKLMAWIIAEGSIEKPINYRSSYRVTIYQSEEKNKKDYDEIKKLLKHFKLNYSEYESSGLGSPVKRMRLNAESSKKIHKWFGTRETIKFIPNYLLQLNQQQSRLFLDTYLKADGFEECKIATTSREILDALQIISVNAGYGFTTLTRKPTIGNKDIFVLRLIKHEETYIQEIKKVDYEGVIWCPHTKNETIIARRKGKVFITGNTPFTNITMDLKVPKFMQNLPAIIGGDITDDTYGSFQDEMDMLNRAFAEVMLEGDASGRPFTFPIPTYNITKDFDWDNENQDAIWEMTGKYGIPYFANFINSDMSPDDVRSMCPIAGDEKVLIKSNRGRGLEYSSIKNVFEGNAKKNDYEIFSDGKFVKGRFNKFENQKMLKVTLENGHELKMTEEHLNFVMKDKESGIIELKGKELKEGMYLPYSLKAYEGKGGNRDLGYFVGAFAGDGSFDGDSTVVFSLENERKKEVIEELIRISVDYFGANYSTKEYEDTKLFTLKIHSKAAVGLCNDFVEGKEREKHYKARLFDKSIEFRRGVLEGHYATDGGNRNRIYSSSKKMVETLNMLAATLGTTTSIYTDDRKNRFGNEPNYSVLIYQLNRSNYGSSWFKFDDKLWVKIKSIEPINNSTAYCFEVENDKPMFTVGTTGILTHNCRLRLDTRELRKRGGGLFGANPLTGSIGVVTINLPKIGYLSKSEDKFFEKLAYLMDLAKESLEMKRKFIEHYTEKGLYPYSRFYLRGIKDMYGEYWKNHFSTIGLIGMNEALLNFMGVDLTNANGHAFAIKIMDFMRDKLAEYQEETGHVFNLEASPAEGATYRLARIDKKNYPKIIVANEQAYKAHDAKPYYTNSSLPPVGWSGDLFEILDNQDPLQSRYTGGTVFHAFLGERIDKEAAKTVVKKVFTKYTLPYLSITPTFSICPIHGYIPGEHEYCPICDEELKQKMKTQQINTQPKPAQ